MTRRLLLLVLAALGARAVAQPQAATAPPSAPPTPPTLPWGGAPAVPHTPAENASGIPDAHAWIVREMPKSGPNQTTHWQAYHVPPRRTVKRADGKAHGSPDGSLRPSATLAARPESIAAWGEKAWFIFEPVTLDPKQPSLGGAREVLAVSARQRIADLWTDEPLDRLLSEPSLPGRGRLAGFIGTPAGPAALVDLANEAAPNRWSLRLLVDGQWADANLPEQAPQMRQLSLVATPGGISVVGIGKSILEWWRGTIDPAPPAEASTPARARITWTRSTRPLTGELLADEACASLFVACRNTLFAAAPSRDDQTWSTVRLLECDARGPMPVAKISGARGRLGLLPMDGLGRLGLVWDISTGPVHTGEAFVLTEVSLLSGAELYSGPWRMMGPLTRSDVVLILVALFLVTASILVFVLRTDATPEVHLPEGLALADPFRRFVASTLDVGLAAMIASRLLDLPLSDLFTADAAASGGALQFMFLTLGLGFVMSTLAEVLFSRSIGKALTGCVVIQVPTASKAEGRVAGGRPALTPISPVRPGPAIVRNLIKWGMSPVVVLTFLEPSGRHRAEVLTSTAVVIPVEPEDESGPADEE